MGVMLSDGFNGALLAALESAVADEGGLMRFIAPKIGGVSCSNNNLHLVTDQIGGAPSVLFDAIVVMPGVDSLSTNPPAMAFLTDAFVHCKFIGWAESASALIEVCGLAGAADAGLVALTDSASAGDFATACCDLRHWPREKLFSS